jgi:hypothetical protein
MGDSNLAEWRNVHESWIYTTGKRNGVAPMFRNFMMTLRFPRVLAELTLSGWAAILVLGGLLISVVVVAYLGWTSAPDTIVPTSGYVALTLGVVFSLVVGVGLMALVFYSSRHDYDEPPKFVQDDIDPEA